MIILRSTGPVISTRRSVRSGGIGATLHTASRTECVSGRKSGRSPASRRRWRSTRRASNSWRRPSQARASVVRNRRASAVRMSANSGSNGACTSSPAPDLGSAVVMIDNVALLLRGGSRGKKRGEPGCHAVPRGGPSRPSCPPVGGEGPQRPCTAAAAAGAVPVFTWLRLCRLFPPDIGILLLPVLHLQPSCHPGDVEPRVDDAVFAARAGAGRPPGAAHSVAILPHMCSAPPTAVGRSVPRREGADKVTGRARYTDDIAVPGAWYGRTIRSTIARGAIRSIMLDPAFDWSRVVVVSADDIPGDNVVQLIRDDQPVLAPNGGEIRHKEEPILLLAAPDRATLEEAASHIHIEYELATAVSDIGSATEVFSTVDIAKGDVASAQREADLVVEREFRVGLQEQLYIEPQGAIAFPEADDTIRVIGSLQCPYYVHRALKRALKLSDQQAVVVQAETGGGFGGKEEYPSI